MKKRTTDIMQYLSLHPHEEGRHFPEAYTVPETFGIAGDGRPLAGSIYFLLGGKVYHIFIRLTLTNCGIPRRLRSRCLPAGSWRQEKRS